MNWYRRSSITVTAKFWNSRTSFCKYCGSDLAPVSVVRNDRHHFYWGQLFECPCGESSLWTNSVRDEKEIRDLLSGKSLDESGKYPGVAAGFCNDLFCPVCWKGVVPIENGVEFVRDASGKLVEIFISRDGIEISGRGKISDDAEIGRILSVKIISFDIFGCSSGSHNDGIVNRGFAFEYGESEYGPIYEWFKNNRNILPAALLPVSDEGTR